ncbi:MAG: hypothetical protein ACE144_14360 [Thermodesulfobacteriota bacterium]
MNSHILVCDFDETLISRLEHRDLVVRMDNLDLVDHAVRKVQERNSLHTVWLHLDAPLSEMDIRELGESSAVSFYLEITGIGDFGKSIDQIRSLRKLNVFVMLAEEMPGTRRDLKILSSLFVPCGITFGNRRPDWESLGDLLSYSVYTKAPHAPIQPFHFVISNYDVQKRIDFAGVYFEDSSRFLHIDTEGSIALSRKELERREFISKDLGQLDHIENHPSYHRRLESWREFFLKPDGCAYCPGWRICLGKFEESPDKESGCMKLFDEWMEAAEYYQEERAKAGAVRRL